MKSSEYKKIELLVVRITKYFGFRVRVLHGIKTVSFNLGRMERRGVGAEQNLLF